MIIPQWLEPYRVKHPDFGDAGDPENGWFQIMEFSVCVSSGKGWDHVSVSRPDRVPTWNEMESLRLMFFGPDSTVMQLHVPRTDHINVHPHCLHLWRPQGIDIPVPPPGLV